MKYIVLICYVISFNIRCYSQVIALNRINFERVNYSNSYEEGERKFNQTIAFIINDYVKKFHKDNLKVIIVCRDTPYDVIIDNEFKSLINQLQNNSKNPDYGLYVRLPDSCLSLLKVINLIDLGFSESNSMLECLKRYVNSDKWFPSWDCYLPAELIENRINVDIEANKYRFLKRMKRKYRLDNIECISKDKF